MINCVWLHDYYKMLIFSGNFTILHTRQGVSVTSDGVLALSVELLQ